MPRRDDEALPPWAASFASTFERVARHLELAEGFMLLPIELPDSITANLLAEWLGRRGLACHSIDINYAAQPRPFLERLREAPADAVATLLFIDQLADWLPAALQLLNQQRDLLTREHPRPLLWSGPTRFLDLSWRSAPDLWSIAAVPIRLPTPVMRSAQPSAPVHRHEALQRLLLSMYSADELRRFIHFQFDPEISDELPGISAPLPALTHALVQVLEQRGLIDRVFFDRLRAERPRRYPEIEAIASQWPASAPTRTNPIDDADDAATLALLALLTHPNQIVLVVDPELRRLHRTIEAISERLRHDHRVRTVPLRAMHDEESAWTASADDPLIRGPHKPQRMPEVTLVVDAEGQPLSALDHEQLGVLRELVRAASDALLHGRPFQLVIPIAGPRARAEATARSLRDAMRSTELPLHIFELAAP